MRAVVSVNYSIAVEIPDIEGPSDAKKLDVMRFVAAKHLHDKLQKTGVYHVFIQEIPYSGGFVTIREGECASDAERVSRAERSDGERSDPGLGGGHQDAPRDPGTAD